MLKKYFFIPAEENLVPEAICCKKLTIKAYAISVY